MQKFIRFFNQPFPYFQKKWQVVVLAGLCIFIVLTIVQSFDLKSNNIYLFALCVGGSTIIKVGCASFVLYLLPLLFRRFFDEKRWTRGKYFVFAFIIALMISLVNTLYYYCLVRKIYYNDFPFSEYLYHNLLTAFLVGIVPTAAGYFWIKNKDLHSDLQEKEEQNRELMLRTRRKKNTSDEKLITLSGNTKDSLTLFPGELLYIAAVGNYVQVYYQQNGQILQKMLRTTLSQMEEFLTEYPFFVRCHRTFLVNTCQIRKINGLKLWLKGLKTAIPVSKANKINVQKQVK